MQSDKEKFKIEFKKRIYQWILRLIKFIDTLPKEISSKVIAHQLLRSGTSIGANYIEAQAASSRKDFINFFHIFLKSANESNFWLSLLKDSHKGNVKEIEILLKELIEISNILGASLLTIKGQR
jgi:four helix bundle protein